MKYTTYKEALKAVKHNGCVLYHVPNEFKDNEMCLIAVKLNGYALRYVPKHLQTVEMIRLALNYNLDNIKYVDLKRFPHFEQYVEVRKL